MGLGEATGVFIPRNLEGKKFTCIGGCEDEDPGLENIGVDGMEGIC